MKRCELCERDVLSTTRHHLIPRMRHRQSRVLGSTTRAQRNETIDLCGPCHKHVHAVVSEKQLAADYNSIAALRTHPEIAKFVRWIARKPPDFRASSERPRARRR